MAEIEVGGITFKGGKMFAVAMALGSAIGVLYGGFEVYKDYQDMKEQIQEYKHQTYLVSMRTYRF